MKRRAKPKAASPDAVLPVGATSGVVESMMSAPATAAATITTLHVVPPSGRLPPFTHIEGNVKRMKGAVTLGERTLILGENQAGKSSIRQAFEFALTSVAPGSGPAGSARFMKYAPANADRLHVTMLSSAGSAMFDVTPGRAVKPSEFFGAYAPLATKPAVLPARDMRDLLVNDKKARRIIFARFGVPMTAQDVAIPSLSEAQRARWNETLAEAAAAGNDLVGTLTEMARLLTSKKVALGKQATAAERALKEAKAAVTMTATDQTLDALREELSSTLLYEAQVEARTRLVALEQQRDHIKAMLAAGVAQREDAVEQADVALRAARAEQDALQAAVSPIRAEQLKVVQAESGIQWALAIDGVLEHMVNTGLATFPILNVPVDAAAKRKEIAEVIQAVRDLVHDARKKIAQIDGLERDARQAVANADRAHQQAKEALRAFAAAEQARLDSILGHITGIKEATKSNVAAAPLRTAAEVREKIASQEAAERLALSIAQEEARIAELRRIQTDVKVLEGEAEALVQRLLGGVKGTAEAAVNRYLPANLRAVLDLSDDGCCWALIGADGRAHDETLSGRENARLMIALGLAWTEGAPFRALCLDDAEIGALSEAHFKELLADIDRMHAEGLLDQTIVVWPRELADPPGWTTVRV